MQNVTLGATAALQANGTCPIPANPNYIQAFGQFVVNIVPNVTSAFESVKNSTAVATIVAKSEAGVRAIASAQAYIGQGIATYMPKITSNPQAIALGEYLAGTGSATTGLITTNNILPDLVQVFRAGSTMLGLVFPIAIPVVNKALAMRSARKTVEREKELNKELKSSIRSTNATAIDTRHTLVADRVEQLQKEANKYHKLSQERTITFGKTLSFALCNISPLMLIPQIGLPVAAAIVGGSAIAHVVGHKLVSWYHARTAQKMEQLIKDAMENVAIDEMYQEILLEQSTRAVEQQQKQEDDFAKAMNDFARNKSSQEEFYQQQIAELKAKLKEMEDAAEDALFEDAPEPVDPPAVEPADQPVAEEDVADEPVNPVPVPVADVVEGDQDEEPVEEDDDVEAVGAANAGNPQEVDETDYDSDDESEEESDDEPEVKTEAAYVQGGSDRAWYNPLRYNPLNFIGQVRT